MSSADFNKVVGAILVSLLAAVAVGIFVNEVMSPHVPEGGLMAYHVDTGATAAPAGEAPAEPSLEPVAPLLATADPAAGEKIAKRCAACHSFDKGGANKVGPNLYGVVGANVAAHEGFTYSGAMSEHGGTWDYAALNEFLANPKAYVPGTKMSFAGLKSVKDRAALIAYLRAQSDNPVPLP
ncbi:MAG: cytochrome c family protein [Alphaproteobacteria bacterium]|jgi:cytochrome c